VIVTLGETMMVFNGPRDRPIGVGATLGSTFAGAESNVAIGLARLGHRVRFLSLLGEDLFGRTIVERLAAEKVDVSGVSFSRAHPTGVMFKNFTAAGTPEVFYYRNTSAFAREAETRIAAEQWRDARLIYLTGITPALSAGCLSLVRRVLADARERQIPVWLDPNYRARLWDAAAYRATLGELLPLVNTVLPGIGEGQLLTGRTEVAEVARALLDLGVKRVVIKADEAGAMVFDAGGVVAARPRRAFACVVDPVGAGDAFAAGYLSAYLEGLDAGESLERGHAMGAMACGASGDWEALPRREQLEQFMA